MYTYIYIYIYIVCIHKRAHMALLFFAQSAFKSPIVGWFLPYRMRSAAKRNNNANSKGNIRNSFSFNGIYKTIMDIQLTHNKKEYATIIHASYATVYQTCVSLLRQAQAFFIHICWNIRRYPPGFQN